MKRSKTYLKKIAPILIVIGLIIIIAGIAIVKMMMDRYSPGTEYANLYELYNIEQSEAVIFVNGLRQDENGILKENRLYLPLTTINESLGGRFYQSDEGNILYAMPTKMVTIPPESSAYTIGSTHVDAGYQIFFIQNAQVYLAADFIKDYTKIHLEQYTAPGRIIIDTVESSNMAANVSNDTQIRYKGGIKSPIITDIAQGETVILLDAMEDWTKVQYNGFTGYIQNKYLGESQAAAIALEGTEIIYPNIAKNTDILLVWHQVFNEISGEELQTSLTDTQGINTISPTWFSLSDNQGNFTSLASYDYVTKAHELGLEVWALIDDFNTEIDLYSILSVTGTRTTLIQNLMDMALEYDLDGINIDFENIKQESGEHFIQFIRELSIQCRLNGIVLSIDNYMPSGGRTWYDFKEQGTVADYVILMGYDEHWNGSAQGSSASLAFTREGLQDTLTLVPADKLIHGLPFYMRVWEETPESLADAGAEIIDDGTSYFGRYALASWAVGMQEGKTLLEENEASISWNSETGQYYGSYELDGRYYRIWLEDVNSLEEKLKVVQDGGVAGVAFWKLGLQTNDVWPVIESYLNN